MSDDTFDRTAAVVREVLEPYFPGRDCPAISRETRLVEDLNADSLDRIEIIMCLEEGLGIEIDDEQAEAWLTVGDIERDVVAARAVAA